MKTIIAMFGENTASSLGGNVDDGRQIYLYSFYFKHIKHYNLPLGCQHMSQHNSCKATSVN